MINALFSWWSQTIRTIIPIRVRGWVAGPSGTIIVKTDGVSVQNVHSLRPLNVLVDENFILRQTHSLPANAFDDFRSAINLSIENSTPFSASDVLVGMRVSQDEHNHALKRVDVAFVPSNFINGALANVGATWRQVCGVRTLEEPVLFLLASKPRRSLLIFCTTTALVCAFLSLVGTGFVKYLTDRSIAAAINADLAELRPRVAELITEAQARTVEAASSGSVSLKAAIPSLTGLLLDLSDGLPKGAEIIRIELREDGLLLSVRGSGLLTLVEQLRANLSNWDIALQQIMAGETAGGLEMGSILIRKPV